MIKVHTDSGVVNMNHLPTRTSSPTPPNLTQQFCLRWHNHQTSLLTSLPLLLDQSHLTDVTLSAEGRTVRAHRVVLSACSSFFSELFLTLDPPFHPVIVIPGASFGSIVALLTFMYSGEVNVFEEQISTLLSLAETLGIKGLADINGKNSSNDKPSQTPPPNVVSPTTPSPPVNAHCSVENSSNKFSLPLESMLAKTFQLCPSMLSNPLNLSPTAISRSAELFSRYQTQCRNQFENKNQQDLSAFDENGNSKNFLNIETRGKRSKMADTRKIDKIAESLRSTSKDRLMSDQQDHLNKMTMVPQNLQLPIALDMKSVPNYGSLPVRFNTTGTMGNGDEMKKECLPNMGGGSSSSLNETGPDNRTLKNTLTPPTTAACGLTPKQTNSKLYATCFICHKQLSNQYNLRVHLETHQNVRYACSVCSHVSRSKDALRKHVSYRHPGAPSPCDSESKRKRSRNSISIAMMQSQIQQQQQQQQQKDQIAASVSPSSSTSSMVSSPVVIKNEIINDLSMTSTGSKLEQTQPHENTNATGSPSNFTIQTPSTSACLPMRPDIDMSPAKRT